jgi:hypothetical protein
LAHAAISAIALAPSRFTMTVDERCWDAAWIRRPGRAARLHRATRATRAAKVQLAATRTGAGGSARARARARRGGARLSARACAGRIPHVIGLASSKNPADSQAPP